MIWTKRPENNNKKLGLKTIQKKSNREVFRIQTLSLCELLTQKSENAIQEYKYH